MIRTSSPPWGPLLPNRPLFSAAGLAATALAIVAIVFLRALAIGPPVVFADEATYATHILSFRDANFEMQVPDILYFALYSWTPALGVNFQAGVKALNALMVGLAFLAIYATARGFVERGPAWAIAAVAALSPISSSAAYVMPDSANFLAFWIVAWCVAVAVPRDFLRGSILGGIACAVLASIKPHGLVVTGAALAAIAMAGLERREALSRIATALLALVAVFLLSRYAIAFASTGGFVFPWFGKFYSTSLTEASSFGIASILGPVFWFCLAGHLLLLALVFLPTAVLAFRPGLPSRPELPPGSLAALVTFTVLSLGLLLGMIVKFSADTSGIAPTETATRLHGRLYEFALPLLALVLWARQPAREHADRAGRAVAIFLAVAAFLVALAAVAYGKQYRPIFVDFPVAIWVLEGSRNLALAIAGLATVAIAAWGESENFRGQRAFAAAIGGQDRALAALARLVPASARDDGAIVARARSPLATRAQFHALSRSPLVVVDKGTLAERDLPPGRQWLLLVDPYRLEMPYRSLIADASGFELVQIADLGLRVADASAVRDDARRISLAAGGGAVVEGFHAPESWGSWTRGTQAKILLDAPVTGPVKLQLVAHAFAGNVGRALTISLGGEQRELKLGAQPSLQEWEFDLKEPADAVVISGMDPVSPLKAGVSADERPLGVGVGSLAIRQREALPPPKAAR